ncbi:MAG: ribosomal protein S18-alanine N-acetyltransferase [Clostridia bacterium]|nr:ribosomal protein S18-alanine N-acetyltransferase [Clostridia bacterium]
MIRRIEKTDSALLSSARKDFPDCWSKEMIDSAFEGGRFFGYLYKDGEGFAFISYSLSVDTADIEDLFVSPSLRGKGIAKELLTAAIKDVREQGRTIVFLEVRTDNIPAINLYTSFGFEKISVRKKYYADGDAFVLKKEI